jgi:hypothetical protein
MEKIRETNFGNSILKVYKNENIINDAIEFMRDLTTDFVIHSIKVEENVEGDMKRIDGETYSIEGFIREYSTIKQIGRELSYSVSGILNEIPVELSFAENSDRVVLDTVDYSIEVDDLFQKKNKGLGL